MKTDGDVNTFPVLLLLTRWGQFLKKRGGDAAAILKYWHYTEKNAATMLKSQWYTEKPL